MPIARVPDLELYYETRGQGPRLLYICAQAFRDTIRFLGPTVS